MITVKFDIISRSFSWETCYRVFPVMSSPLEMTLQKYNVYMINGMCRNEY